MEINNDMIKNGNETVKDDIKYFRNQIESKIEDLSKNSLQRLLKVYSGFSYANELLGDNPIKLTDEENLLLKQALTLQENCLGYSKLKEELNNLPNNKGENNG